MFPCRHRGEMFAMPGLCLLALRRVTSWLPGASSQCLLGERTGGREALTCTQEMRERPQNVLCVARGRRSTSHTALSGGKKTLLFLGWSGGARGTRVVSLEARLNVRAAMEAADLTNALRRRMETDQLLSNMYTAGFGVGMEAFCFGLVWLQT